MNVGQAVRERIAELCEEKHITINKLANISGITQSTLNNIMSGRNRLLANPYQPFKKFVMVWKLQ